MKRLIGKLLSFIALIALLGACTANHPLPVRGDENIFARPVQTDIFPGNFSSYSFGTFQKPENFENVERAQFGLAPFPRTVQRFLTPWIFSTKLAMVDSQ